MRFHTQKLAPGRQQRYNGREDFLCGRGFYWPFLIKLMSPLRSTRARRTCGNVVRVAVQAHVVFQIMDGNMVAPHHVKIALAITHNGVRRTLHQNSKPVRIICELGEDTVKQYQNYAATESREKSRRAIDCA
jgi:hypothetical protein